MYFSTPDFLDLAKTSNDLAREKGWYDSERSSTEMTLLVASEVYEAFEDIRTNHWSTHYTYRDGVTRLEPAYEGVLGKPCGYLSELADVIIRVADLVGEGFRRGTLSPEDFDTGLLEDLIEKHVCRSTVLKNPTADIYDLAVKIQTNPLHFGWDSGQPNLTARILTKTVAMTFGAAASWFGEGATYLLVHNIKEKMAYNRTRGHRHGGKAL